MKKILSAILALFMIFTNLSATSVWAIQEMPQRPVLKPAPNARKIEFAFVFDGHNDKNQEVMKTFQTTIAKSLLPDYIAVFPKDLVFTGDWTKEGAAKVSQKALDSRATTIIALGYFSSSYLDSKRRSKFIITIDEYGLRDMGSNAFFNPLKQYVGDFILFKKLVPNQKKLTVLMSENFYKTQKDWHSMIDKKLREQNCIIDFTIIPVSNKNVSAALNKIPKDTDTVFVTPMFNLSSDQRKEMYKYINSKKLPSFSSAGKVDVDLGAMLGTSTPDVGRKLAEATSFNIHGVLHGHTVKNEKIPFYDEKIIFYNKDTGEEVGYSAPLRLLNNCEIISHKPVTMYDLSYVFNTLDESNLDIKQKKYLVDAARRATTSAYLRYLPTLRLDLGYQTYNSSYAKSYTDVPTKVGQFVFGLDQVIYSPDLVTNIIVKHKKLKVEKAEKVLTEQNMGLQIANLYIETLMLQNMIKVQEEHLAETRENLAMSRVREKAGYCGREEILQWAGLVSEEEKKLLGMRADFKNVKIHINKLLYKNQTEEFDFKPLTAVDPAFFTSDICIIDHVRTPEKLDKFTDMFVKEAQFLSPETIKLRAAIAMKKAEMSNYAQKFVLPNAMMSLEYGKQFGRDLPYEVGATQSLAQLRYLSGYGFDTSNAFNTNSTRFFIGAQWKPIEGGHKIAEIARCKSELNQLNTYLTEVNTDIERNVREIINRAISKYFMIEKSYKSMFAEAENYQYVKALYLQGKAPITQLSTAQDLYTKAKIDALNSQYEFFKELVWVQRGLVSINWSKASDEAKKWIKGIPAILPAEPDFVL